MTRAKATPAKTEREQAYIAAVEALYAGEVAQPVRTLAYERAMEAVVTKYPTDTEAKIFYAIALDAAADLADQTYAKQLKAAAILEAALSKQPNHPGIAHYLIHSYDVPALAGKGLNAARSYAKIAPDAPHALHMPSHIFTRVGAWQDSIESNRASAAAAKNANSPAEELHAMDYQAYAYLQLGQDDDARRVLAETKAILARVESGSGYAFAGVYGATAIPARVVLERGAWAEASGLTPQTTAVPQRGRGDALRTRVGLRAKRPACRGSKECGGTGAARPGPAREERRVLGRPGGDPAESRHGMDASGRRQDSRGDRARARSRRRRRRHREESCVAGPDCAGARAAGRTAARGEAACPGAGRVRARDDS